MKQVAKLHFFAELAVIHCLNLCKKVRQAIVMYCYDEVGFRYVHTAQSARECSLFFKGPTLKFRNGVFKF